MTRDARERQTHVIQTFPGGTVYEYRGDPHGPSNQRSLRVSTYNASLPDPWRKGTAAEWEAIRIETIALRYQDREVLCCDSALVSELLGPGTMDGFQYEDIRNLYVDPEEWDAEQCREYLSDKGIGGPEPCHACARLDINNAGLDCDHYLDELREAVREHSQDHPAEVFEWWRVSSWLCEQLHEIGEVTMDNGYGCWWGRTTTGQGFIMDGVLQDVARHVEGQIAHVARAERLVVKP